MTMGKEFCCSTVSRVLLRTVLEISNKDQRSQHTAKAFIDLLKVHPIRVSMDEQGRALENVFAERLCRSVKHEEVYLP